MNNRESGNGLAISLGAFKAFYQTPMINMIKHFLDNSSGAYENLLRRINNVPADKEYFSKWMQDYYHVYLIGKVKVKKLSAAEQTLLGIAFEHGLGVEMDFGRAHKLYKMAAEKNNATAYLNLGSLCERGLGTKKNLELAFFCYEAARELGKPSALIKMGELYRKGYKKEQWASPFDYTHEQQSSLDRNMDMLGLRISDRQAKQRIYYQAIENGDIESLLTVGSELVFVTQKNREMAIACFEAVIGLGDIRGLIHLAQMDDPEGNYQNKIYRYALQFSQRNVGCAYLYLGRHHEKMAAENSHDPKLQYDHLSQAANHYRSAAENKESHGRDCLLNLYVKTGHPIACYHAIMYPTAYIASDYQDKLRRDFTSFANNNMRELIRLTFKHRDSWGKIQLLLDPHVKMDQRLVLTSHRAVNNFFPGDVKNLILQYMQPKLKPAEIRIAIEMKMRMYDEVKVIRHSILSRTWKKEGLEKWCGGSIRFFDGNKSFRKAVPVAEVEKWNVTEEVRDGKRSVHDAVKQIATIEAKSPQLYSRKK